MYQYAYIFRATVRIFLHSNTAVNVWIYGGRLREFRDCFQKDCLALPCCQIKCCKRCLNSFSKTAAHVRLEHRAQRINMLANGNKTTRRLNRSISSTSETSFKT